MKSRTSFGDQKWVNRISVKCVKIERKKGYLKLLTVELLVKIWIAERYGT